MCIKTYQHFTKCDHVSTTLTTCPTYHKQQESANSLFGCIFRRGLKRKKNCGKVVPHHFQNETYCQACLVKRDHFRAQGVGQGALKVRKQGFQEIFHEENKEAARAALRKSAKHRHPSKRLNHEVLYAETSVWLTDLYHHPETLAKKETFSRRAALAPPVSSHPPKRSPHRVRDVSPKRRRERHQGQTTQATSRREWMPAYGGSQPFIKPTQPASTYGYSRHQANNVPGPPPVVGLRPLPQQARQSYTGRVQDTRHPELRHKVGHIQSPGRSRSQQPAFSYPAYEDEATKAASRARQHASAPVRGPVDLKPFRREEPSRWEARKAAISSWVDKAKDKALYDNDSDISFACKTSQAIQPIHKRKKRSYK